MNWSTSGGMLGLICEAGMKGSRMSLMIVSIGVRPLNGGRPVRSQ